MPFCLDAGDPFEVAIRGDSVAAWCSAHLLSAAGLNPVLDRTPRQRVPAIMISDAAVAMIRDVFGKPGLFAEAPRITRRVVQWGRNSNPAAFDHAAIVVSELELLNELEEDLTPAAGPRGGGRTFTILASRPLPVEASEHCFGSRIAQAAQVELKDERDSAACWIESMEDGWLFLIPNSADSGWLLSVGCAETIPSRSTLIKERVASIREPQGAFPASPRIMSPLSGPGWLACGTAGMAFDPICGDGTAHAVREAVLASAVVKAIAKGGNQEGLRRHYEARLVLGFHRHLAASLEFYCAGTCGPWWEKESAMLRRGVDWCAGKLSSHGQFRYQLRGFELQPIDSTPS